MKAPSRFPWRVFSRVVLIQSTLVLVSLGAAGIAARHFFKRQFLLENVDPEHLFQILKVFDTSLVLFLVLMAAVLSIFALWVGRKLLFPLGRLLLKAEGGSPVDENELGEDTYGEWSDLESSIEHIRKDLEAKTESLSMERQQLATLMSSISDAILAVDLDGTPLFFNSRYALLFGEGKLKIGRAKLWEAFREPELLDAFRSALNEGKVVSLKATPFEQANGRKYFSLSVSPLRRTNGVIYGAVGIFHDVTELKVAEQIRIDFVANVSHELRTPLTAIKGYTDTIVQDLQQGKAVAKEFLEIVSRNVERLMSLINDLLDLSSLDSATDSLQKMKLDPTELTMRVVEQLRPSFERKAQKVSTKFSVSQVVADPRRLEQVLINLLDNAHKYTPSGGAISVQWEQGSDAEVLLKVTDTGPGIPREHHQRLFERFYRVDKARSRELGGTGLGLAIVKHIMQRHNGLVWVSSEVGKGSEFICQFPS